MAQASAIAAWLMLVLKVALGLMVFSIILLCLIWAIRSRKSSRNEDADCG